MEEKMKRAYKYASTAFREKLKKESKIDDEVLNEIKSTDVIVLKGEYDRAELVLEALEIKFTCIEPNQLKQIELKPEQTVLVNCPGNVDRAGIEKIRQFVE